MTRTAARPAVALTQLAYTVDQAAKAVGQSADTIRRAIRSTDPTVFPPPLRAKRAGSQTNSPYLIPAAELDRWLASLPDA